MYFFVRIFLFCFFFGGGGMTGLSFAIFSLGYFDGLTFFCRAKSSIFFSMMTVCTGKQNQDRDGLHIYVLVT